MFENLSETFFLGQKESAILVLTKSAKIVLIINLTHDCTSFCKIVTNLKWRLNQGPYFADKALVLRHMNC